MAHCSQPKTCQGFDGVAPISITLGEECAGAGSLFYKDHEVHMKEYTLWKWIRISLFV